MSTQVDGETVILDSAAGKYFGVNATGTLILDSLLATGDIEETAKKMCETYSVDMETARDDVRRFIDSMIERGLLAQT